MYADAAGSRNPVLVFKEAPVSVLAFEGLRRKAKFHFSLSYVPLYDDVFCSSENTEEPEVTKPNLTLRRSLSDLIATMLKLLASAGMVVKSVLEAPTPFIPNIEEVSAGNKSYVFSLLIDLFGKITSVSTVSMPPVRAAEAAAGM